MMRDSKEHIDELAERAESALKNSASDPDAFASLLAELRATLDSAPQAGPMLGPLIGRLNRARQANEQAHINWVPVLQGHLAIGHRPKIKTVENMRWTGVTHVLTLLSASEGAEAIGTLVQQAGLEWIWLPLPSADPPEAELTTRCINTFNRMTAALQNGARIYVHCSAGIHRTGMVTYGFLRYAGLDRDHARATLAALRTETFEGAGDERLQWGAQFG